MNKINRYLNSLVQLPTWIGFPIFCLSLIIPIALVIFTTYLLVAISSWFLLLPVVIWAICAINWWINNRDK